MKRGSKKWMSWKWAFGSLVLMMLVGLANAGEVSAQASQDIRQLQKEIRVMESILSTSMDLAAKETMGSSRDERFPLLGEGEIQSNYLMGQGVTFQLSVPSSPLLDDGQFAAMEEGLAGATSEGLMEAQLALSEARIAESMYRVQEAQERILARQKRMQERESTGGVPPPPAPPEPPAAPEAPPPPPADLAPEVALATGIDKADLERQVKQVREQMEKMRQQTREAAGKVAEYRKQLETVILDVLQHHGSSLTQLPSSEYINFVFVSGTELAMPIGRHWRNADSGGADSGPDTWTVKMADVRELGAGKITRQQFENRIQKY